MRYQPACFRPDFARCFRQLGTLSGCAVLLVGLSLTTGCGTDTAKKSAEKAEHQEGDGHKEGEASHPHAEEGPHKGQLIELGKEEYHAELIHDDAAHKITIYLLDGAAKKSVPIAETALTVNVIIDGKPAQFKLPSVPQTDDPVGQSSRFELTDEPLCEALDDSKSKGRLNVTIAGKQFSGELSHEPHADHK